MAYRRIIRRKNKSESRRERERERLIDSTLFLNGEDISTKADSHICERERELELELENIILQGL